MSEALARIRGKCAIVGIGATKQGEHPDRSANELAVEAAMLALADAGIDKKSIDGLITCKDTQGQGIDHEIGQLLGLNPSYSATLDYGTCNFSLHLAVMAIASGLANTVLLTYATNQRTNKVDFGTRGMASAAADLTAPYGFLHISGHAALAFKRHQALYGTTEEQLGHIAVAQRAWAQLNPAAIFTEPLSIEEYMASPYLVEPLRRHDVTMISDGGAAVVVTSAERSLDMQKQPVYVLGMAQQTALRQYQNEDALMRPWLSRVAKRVYENAGLGPEDIDIAYFQDPTSVWVLQMLEAYICGIGEGGPFVAAGHTRPGGKLPVNTNGGQLSEAYMWGWLHMVEAVRQLRGECGSRQVPGAETALYASSMAFLKGAASILSRTK